MNLKNLKTWEDVVTVASQLREDRDRLSWELGDVVNHACAGRRDGRPALQDRHKTISQLANEIGEARTVLSNLASNSEFYDPHTRKKIPPQISWRQAAEARRNTGWKPGSPVDREMVELALSMLYQKADYTKHPAVVTLQSYLERSMDILERSKGHPDYSVCSQSIIAAEQAINQAIRRIQRKQGNIPVENWPTRPVHA